MKKKILLFPVAMLYGFILVSFTDLDSYSIRLEHANEDYISLLESGSLVKTVAINESNESGSYQGEIKYYQSMGENVNYLSVIISLDLTPINDTSNSIVDSYNEIKKLEIISNTNSNDGNEVKIINHLATSPQVTKKLHIGLTIDSYAGKKNIANNANSYEYYSDLNLIENTSKANYDFYECTNKVSIKTYFIYEYPQSSLEFDNTITIKAKFTHNDPIFGIISKNDINRITKDYSSTLTMNE